MPFFSPLWYGDRGSSSSTTCTPRCGGWSCRRAGPLGDPWSAGSRPVLPAEPDRDAVGVLAAEIVDMLGSGRPGQRGAARGRPPLQPGGHRSPTPLVVAVGRLVPVKRFDVLIGPGQVKTGSPSSGRHRRRGVRAAAARGARDGRGRGLDQLARSCRGRGTGDWYRRAWVVASTSQREGWGMTLTEAAACGTPAVATASPGMPTRWSTASPACWWRTWVTPRPRSGASRATTCCAAASPRRAGPSPPVHLGRHRPPRPRGAGPGGDTGILRSPGLEAAGD